MDPQTHSLWHPTRLMNIGSTLDRYSRHLGEGHRIRVGMEGDPFYPYRSTSDAPTGRVIALSRSTDGQTVDFTVKSDLDGTLLQMNNRSIHPTQIWEIDPEHLDTFRSSVMQHEERTASAPPDEESDLASIHHEADDPNDIQTDVKTLNRKISLLEAREKEWKDSLFPFFKGLAQDLVRVTKPDKQHDLTWANTFLSKYSEEETPSSDAGGRHGDPELFRAASKSSLRNAGLSPYREASSPPTKNSLRSRHDIPDSFSAAEYREPSVVSDNGDQRHG